MAAQGGRDLVLAVRFHSGFQSCRCFVTALLAP